MHSLQSGNLKTLVIVPHQCMCSSIESVTGNSYTCISFSAQLFKLVPKSDVGNYDEHLMYNDSGNHFCLSASEADVDDDVGTPIVKRRKVSNRTNEIARIITSLFRAALATPRTSIYDHVYVPTKTAAAHQMLHAIYTAILSAIDVIIVTDNSVECAATVDHIAWFYNLPRNTKCVQFDSMTHQEIRTKLHQCIDRFNIMHDAQHAHEIESGITNMNPLLCAHHLLRKIESESALHFSRAFKSNVGIYMISMLWGIAKAKHTTPDSCTSDACPTVVSFDCIFTKAQPVAVAFSATIDLGSAVGGATTTNIEVVDAVVNQVTFGTRPCSRVGGDVCKIHEWRSPTLSMTELFTSAFETHGILPDDVHKTCISLFAKGLIHNLTWMSDCFFARCEAGQNDALDYIKSIVVAFHEKCGLFLTDGPVLGADNIHDYVENTVRRAQTLAASAMRQSGERSLAIALVAPLRTPTSTDVKSLCTPTEKKIYSLIWDYVLDACLPPFEIDVADVVVDADIFVGVGDARKFNQRHSFRKLFFAMKNTPINTELEQFKTRSTAVSCRELSESCKTIHAWMAKTQMAGQPLAGVKPTIVSASSSHTNTPPCVSEGRSTLEQLISHIRWHPEISVATAGRFIRKAIDEQFIEIHAKTFRLAKRGLHLHRTFQSLMPSSSQCQSGTFAAVENVARKIPPYFTHEYFDKLYADLRHLLDRAISGGDDDVMECSECVSILLQPPNIQL